MERKQIPSDTDAFQKIKQWMERVPFLTKEDLDLFEPFLSVRKLKEKELFLSESAVCREIGFVTSGAFRLYYLSDGREINTDFFFENDFVVDYDSFIYQKPGRYFIQALEDSEIIPFGHSLLMHAYNTSKNWERFGRTMAEYQSKIITERVESFLCMEGKQRYQQLIKTRPDIVARISLYHIASYLGMERESLSRIRKNIVKEKRR